MNIKYFTFLLVLALPVTAQEPSFEELREATYNYLEMARSGNPYAQFMASQAYWNGWGVPKNEKIATRWLNMAVEQRHPLAIYDMGKRKLTGDGVEADKEIGIKYLEEAERLGVLDASVVLGSYYLQIDSSNKPINNKEAKSHLLKAAKKGHSGAMFYLGLMYHRGLEPGTPLDAAINLEKAIDWYEKAAEKLNVLAIANLGLIYWHPSNQNIDYQKAYFWFRITKLLGPVHTN